MKNHKRVSVPRLFTPVALAITLAACSSTSSTSYVDITSAPTQSAQNYLMQADSSQGSIQNDWLLMALKAATQEGNVQQANLILSRLSKQNLTVAQQAGLQIATARLLLAQKRSSDAMKQLHFQRDWSLSASLWQEYYQLRADLFAQQGNYIAAAQALTLTSPYVDSSQQRAISEQIWNNLSQYKADDIMDLRIKDNAELAGWVQLTQYVKSQSGNLSQLQKSITQWMQEHPNHPASRYTPESLHNLLTSEITTSTNPALLLPLTGKYAPQGKLIRDGFMMQMQNDPNYNPTSPPMVIDTNAASMEQIQQTLVQNHIDFIVGPLLKKNVDTLEQLQQAQAKPIPTLALNIPEKPSAGFDVCYLALSPEQESAQAAKHLYELGYQSPLIFTPKNNLGDRIANAFKDEWQKHSPYPVSVSQFGDKRQLQQTINEAFSLQASQQRIAKMQSLIGENLLSQPRSRQDVDAVYIVASSDELTLIKPFIEVAISPKVAPPKLFTNSFGNSGRPQYEDLSGVMYSDIPLLISPDPQIKSMMEAQAGNESNAQKRLKAMGMDAYTLLESLPQMKLSSGYVIQGQTGVLSIGSQCVIQRELSWGEYGKETPVTDTQTDARTSELPTALPDDMVQTLQPSL